MSSSISSSESVLDDTSPRPAARAMILAMEQEPPCQRARPRMRFIRPFATLVLDRFTRRFAQ